MFKLIRIEHSSTNQPSVIKMPKISDVAIPIGMPLANRVNYVVPCGETDVATFMSYAEAKAEDPYVLCYRVTPSMLFEAPFGVAGTDIMLGDHVCFMTNDDGYAYGVAPGDGYGCMIVDITSCREKNGKVIVSFLEEQGGY
ncbi:MAG: hypothetical protein IJY18_05570 [Clostridia bacterium]|nr:hypothetical protein [Clostridia bacterium]